MAKAKKSPSSPSSVNFLVTGAARPGAGTKLASYTEAWLQLSGLADGGTIPAAKAKLIMGDTAYGYHTRKGNFEKTDQGFRLTPAGEAHFAIGTNNRLIRPEPEMVKVYTEAMRSGKADGDLIKNADLIKKLS